MYTITWTDPRTGDGWAIHETECGRYRIDQSGTEPSARYTPRYIAVIRKTDYGTKQFWERIGPDVATINDAMDAVNTYHCNTYNLVQVIL